MHFCVQSNQRPRPSTPRPGARRGARRPYREPLPASGLHCQFTRCWEGPSLSEPGRLRLKTGIRTRPYNTAGGLKRAGRETRQGNCLYLAAIQWRSA